MVYNSEKHPQPCNTQRGAALVEFALVFVVFLSIIFAIIEFSLVIFNASRLAEATRAASRYAVVNDPACDIYGKGTTNAPGCPGSPEMTCPGSPPVELEVDSCTFPATTTECRMVEEMDKMMGRTGSNSILSGNGKVVITYACSDTGDPDVPQFVPVVTVSAEDIRHPMLLSGILGISLESDCAPYSPPCLTLPTFETSRTGEDMYTE